VHSVFVDFHAFFYSIVCSKAEPGCHGSYNHISDVCFLTLYKRVVFKDYVITADVYLSIYVNKCTGLLD